MSDWFNWYTFIAFVLGVMLSAMVKRQTSTLRAKVA